MTNKPALLYWDSCVFISCIQHDPRRFATLEAIVEEARSGKIILVASTMVLAETVKLSGDDALRKQEEQKIHDAVSYFVTENPITTSGPPSEPPAPPKPKGT